MKNILFLIIFLILGHISYTQDYEVKIKLTIWDGVDNHSGRCTNQCDIHIDFFDDSKKIMVSQDLGGVGGPGTRTTFNYTYSFPIARQLKNFETWGRREWYRDIFGCKAATGDPDTKYLPLPLKLNECFHQLYYDQIAYWKSEMEIWIYPKNIQISSTGGSYLPMDKTNSITINATTGTPDNYPLGFYNWEYQTETDGVWKSIPGKTGKTSFTLNGIELWGRDAEKYVNQNIYIRLNMGGEKYSNILTFRTSLSSPHIISYSYIAPTCFDGSNGSVTLYFDRALIPNESLSIFIDNRLPPGLQKTAIYNLTSLESGNIVRFPAIFEAGGYRASLIGKYPDGSVATYTDGGNHSYQFDVYPIAPIVFSPPLFNSVRCFGSKDGTIQINATGGTGPYQLCYKKEWERDFSRWISFINNYTIDNLDTGTYEIKLQDANKCYPKDNFKKEIIHKVKISQPKESLTIDHSDTIPPRGAGLKDGKIIVYIKGGTPNTGGTYTVIWKDNLGTILSTGIVNTSLGTIYKTELQSVGKGKYYLTITDANSCKLDTNFTLTEPPPIIGNITQQHIVSCNAGSDGILHIKATGGVPFKSDQPYQYEWYKIVDSSYININQTDSIAVNLTAGNYSVKITDANNISRYSSVFTLTEPIVIRPQFQVNPITCINKGSITASITGGTAPYRIEWTTGDTTLSIHNLTQQGNYLAYIQDSRGCEGKDKVFLPSPNIIIINNINIKNPTYANNSDGAIQLSVSGGNPPYTYLWNNRATTKNIQNLMAGVYSLTITDASGCTQTQNYTLQNPPRIIQVGGIPLGNGITTKTLCNGQHLDIDATINDNAATYQWNSNNGFSANTAKVSLMSAGKYWITITDSRGISASDTLIVQQVNANINASCVASTQAFKGERVGFVNVSYPVPERIEWLIPNSSKIETLQTNQKLAELIFKDTGTYTISMKAFVGQCEQIITKKVMVIEGQKFDDIGATQNPFVKEFTIAPNPNSGQFNVKIVLQEQGKIRLRMMNANNSVLIDNRELSGSSQYTVPYSVTAAAGMYILLLETPKGNDMRKIIVN